MIAYVVALALWAMLAASVVFTWYGLRARSWQVLWVAAALSLVFSGAAAFSFGPLTILLTGLQAAGAVALRRGLRGRGWAVALGGAGAVWAVAVPLNLAWLRWPPLVLAIPAAILLAALATAARGERRPVRD